MNIETRIHNIIEKYGKSIVVLKGFQELLLPNENKYFDFSMNNLDKIDLKKIEQEAIDTIIGNLNMKEDYLWMTIEEYQIFKEYSKINKFKIIVLENNLYYKQFPYNNTLSDIDEIYKLLYYIEDEDLTEELKNSFENVSYFYGSIDYSKNKNRYYVTYPEIDIDENIEIIKYFDENKSELIISENYPVENVEQIELSEVETQFLDITQDILNGKSNKNILFVISSKLSELPNNYNERIGILKNLSNNKFYFITQSLKRKLILNESEYYKLLKEIFNYDEFKELEFYENIETKSKKTTLISQAQIIDDIVQQAENALNDEDFRDIYITAPTGSGKSIMFQIPALYLANKYKEKKPMTIVISPLIGLMNDQVNSMKKKGIYNAATINGNTLPFEKEQTLEDIQNNKIDILYISPETLQARSDIKLLIGNRNIGAVIIDEAHIVTTWGKSFRADYWYLGVYLSKLRKAYKFPIITFTATAIYGGREDMYIDTRNSLNLISPISYFGTVKRKNIFLKIKNGKEKYNESSNDYRKAKNTATLKHIIDANKKGEKSLIYFPTIRLLNDFYRFIDQNSNDISKKTGKFYGGLSKEEKDEVLSEFKDGNLKFVLATKAFGMGIDIADINNVYHYAPTGNVVDYIQEIGRAGRDKDKIKFAFAEMDYLPKDFNDVRKLYGMSAIRKNQIIEVMKKIKSIYKEKGNNRNLLVSSEDFKYIFNTKVGEENNIDNKVKTVLLMIEKDFESPNKLGYSPFVARPRSLYGKDLIFVTSETEIKFNKSILKNYFNKLYDLKNSFYSGIYEVDLSSIWEKYYKYLSFPSFKYNIFSDGEEELKHREIFKDFVFTSGIEVNINNNYSKIDIKSKYNIILDVFNSFINNYKMTEKYFSIYDLGQYLQIKMNISNKFEARSFAQTIINAAFELNKIKNINFIKERENSSENKILYQINQDGDIFKDFILSGLEEVLSPNKNYIFDDEDKNIKSFYLRNKGLDNKIAALGIGQSRDLLSYQIIGGYNPQIYMRINSISPLEKAINAGDYYINDILKDVQNKHYTSVEMLKYLFEKPQAKIQTAETIFEYSSWFWEKIEDYFMGKLPDEVNENLQKY